MSNATFTFGRFNPPTEEGHGKLVSAVQQHAEKTSGTHYVFPSHSQDAKKNPLSHNDKSRRNAKRVLDLDDESLDKCGLCGKY